MHKEVDKDTPELLDSLGFFQEGFNVVDLGCGTGFEALWCYGHGRNINYLGLDVRRACIDTCGKFQLPENFVFKYLDVFNSVYNKGGKILPEDVVLSTGNSHADSIICHSLFTHLDSEKVATHYMSEIWRILKPGGLLWTSWFLFPPNIGSEGSMRTVYGKEFVAELLKPYQELIAFGGTTSDYNNQWYVASRKL
jgi:SAM-dependent methyltransferase